MFQLLKLLKSLFCLCSNIIICSWSSFCHAEGPPISLRKAHSQRRMACSDNVLVAVEATLVHPPQVCLIDISALFFISVFSKDLNIDVCVISVIFNRFIIYKQLFFCIFVIVYCLFWLFIILDPNLSQGFLCTLMSAPYPTVGLFAGL